MKKVLVLLTLVATVSAYSQSATGTVAFNNKNPNVTPAINAPITYGGLAAGTAAGTTLPVTAGTKAGALGGAEVNGYGGVNATVGLYGGPAGTPEAKLVLLVPSAPIYTGTKAGYINYGSAASRYVQGTIDGTPFAVTAGSPAALQLRAWDAGVAADSFEAATLLVSDSKGVYLGKSTVLTLNTGGTGTPAGPAADLIGLNAFAMDFVQTPEPSIIGLGILGAAAGLFVFRRRN